MMASQHATSAALDAKPLARPTVAKPFLALLALLFAATTATYSFLWMYYVRWETRVEIGLDINNDSGEIVKIYPNGPAERAGLRAHDQIVAVNGHPLTRTGPDIVQQTWLRGQPGESVALTIRRPGEAGLLQITPVFRAVAGAGTLRQIADQVLGSYPIAFLIVGLTVLFMRVGDRHAWLLAILCACFISVSELPQSLAAVNPEIRTFMFGFRAIMEGMLPFTFYLFFAIFPQRSPLDRRAPWLKWVLAGMGVLVAIPGIAVGRPQPPAVLSRIAGSGPALNAMLVYIYATIVLTLASLVWTAFHTAEPDARRKLRVVLWGTLAGVIPATVTKLISDFGRIQLPFWFDFIDVITVTLFPLSFAYAVVKHQVMEIPVLLRHSARYVLVKRGFGVLLFLLAISINVLLGIVLSRIFKMQPALAMSIGGGFGIGLAWLSASGVRQTTQRIDRAFFREAYDARIILQDLAQKVRSIGSKQELLRLVEAQLNLALHPTSLVGFLRTSDGMLQSLHQTDSQPAISASSPGLHQLRLIAEPLDVSRYGDLSQLTPELAWLHPECLVPVLSRSAEMLGLIVLGAKRSEEPYSWEDKQLLGSIAGQMGVALESISLAEEIARRIESDRRAQQEMEIARAVQSKLLPQQQPPLASLDYAGTCIQARAVGGDYYDFLDLGSGRVGFVLADIAGKGISGALLMANLQASLRSMYGLAQKDLAQLLCSVNHLFFKNTESNHYATMFVGVYDDKARKLLYANCGHNPPLLLRVGESVEHLAATATVLGLFEQWQCSVAEVELHAGDVLAIYTDGITEAERGGEEFGEERLIAALRKAAGQSAQNLMETALKSVQAFSPGEQSDDLTLIIGICR